MFPEGVCWSWTARVRCTGIIKVSSGQGDKCLLSPSGRMSSVLCPAEYMVASGRLLMLPCSVSAGLVELLVEALSFTSQILPKHICVCHPTQGQQCQKGRAVMQGSVGCTFRDVSQRALTPSELHLWSHIPEMPKRPRQGEKQQQEAIQCAKPALWIVILGASASPALVVLGELNENGKTGEGRSMGCRMATLRSFWECSESLVLT